MRAGPCKNCEERTLGCHSCCENYKEWSSEREKELKASYYNNQASAVLIERAARVKANYQRKMKRRTRR